jgi:hypothetical protein
MTTSTKAVKVPNYTPEMVDTMKAMYKGEDNVAEVKAISLAVGRSENSVRAKLNTEKLYKKAVVVKAASGRVTKAAKVAGIGAILGLSDAEEEGLIKATAAPLEKILAALQAAAKAEAESEE